MLLRSLGHSQYLSASYTGVGRRVFRIAKLFLPEHHTRAVMGLSFSRRQNNKETVLVDTRNDTGLAVISFGFKS